MTSSSPASIRSEVDLPQPDGPTSTMNSPSAISRSRSRHGRLGGAGVDEPGMVVGHHRHGDVPSTRCVQPPYDVHAHASSGSALTCSGAPGVTSRRVLTAALRLVSSCECPHCGSALTGFHRPDHPARTEPAPSGRSNTVQHTPRHTGLGRRRRPGRPRRLLALSAAGVLSLAVLSACGDDDDGDGDDGVVELTVATFNEFGYEGAHRGVERRQPRHPGDPEEGRHLGRGQGEPLHQARRQLRPLRHRGDRG